MKAMKMDWLENRIEKLARYPYIMDWASDVESRVKEGERHVILFLDGLGTGTRQLIPRSGNALITRYRTVFPSSTPTFFYSFYSGLDPGEHGYLEWYMKFKGKIITIPPWTDTRDNPISNLRKKDVFPFKGIAKRVKPARTAHLSPFANTVFTRYASAGANSVRINGLADALAFRYGNFDLTIIYWPSPDHELHDYWLGPPTMYTLKYLALFVKALIRVLPRGAQLHVLGDHGLTYVSRELRLHGTPTGGGRVAFCDGGVAIPRGVRQYELGELEGLMGKCRRVCKSRFGDAVLLAPDGMAFKYPWSGSRHLGQHGGLTDEEMFVDIASIRVS